MTTMSVAEAQRHLRALRPEAVEAWRRLSRGSTIATTEARLGITLTDDELQILAAIHVAEIKHLGTNATPPSVDAVLARWGAGEATRP